MVMGILESIDEVVVSLELLVLVLVLVLVHAARRPALSSATALVTSAFLGNRARSIFTAVSSFLIVLDHQVGTGLEHPRTYFGWLYR
ncbi:MAG: hypothetical protein JO345_10190 [Streptosporangiaceae bacterium]|nr:hypothetical protein [Streptosporangiaceae bacterium]